MFIFPGYVSHRECDDAIYVSSELFHNKIKITDPNLQEEFRLIVHNGGIPEINTPLTEFLHSQELLVTHQEINKALIEAKKLLSDTLILTIMPTEGCNFRCSYCYENHTPNSMTPQMLDQLKKFITSQAQNYKAIRLNWFGGEPTLCRNAVLEISELVKSMQAKYGLHYSASMTTNGYLLNLDFFLQLLAAGVNEFQITLDGWDHNKTRPHASGKGTLQQILANLTVLSALPANLYDYKIIIRRNILDGDTDFTWYDHLYSLFGHDPRFMIVVRTVNDWGGDSVEKLNIAKGTNKSTLLRLHEGYLEKIGMPHSIEDNSLFSRICYAAYPNGFVFRANGDIVKCTVALDHPNNQVGRIDMGNGVILSDEVNHLWYDNELKQECFTCPDVLSCFNMQCKRAAITESGKPYCHRNLSLITED